MSILFDEVRDALLDFVYRGIPVSTTAERWLGLVRGGSAELTGGGYARVRIDGLLTGAVDGALTNIARILFPTPTGDWATDGATHALVFEQGADGNALAALPLAAPLTIRAGDTVDITPGRFLGSVAKNLTTEWRNLVADLLFRGVTPTVGQERWLALYKTNAEVSGGGYARVRVDDKLSTPVDGEIKNSTVIAFPPITADWSVGDPICRMMLCEAASGGRAVCEIPLEYGIEAAKDDTLRFEPGRLTLTLGDA